ncbi:hypothetical protein ACWGI8_22725 [Streptomyces sp. NPDC054841]
MPVPSWRSWHRPLVAFSASMALLAVVSAVGLVVDDRVLVGAPIWAKPFKFAVSFVAYALTFAWMLSLLARARPSLRRPGWWAGTVVVAASAVEMVIITAQVVRGKRSHFNHETPFDGLLYDTMALTVVVLWVAGLVIALLLFRARIADRATTWAIRLGAVLAVAGAALGALMTQPTPEQEAAADGSGVATVVGAHSVGVPDGGPGMPLTGWSATGGDLRIPHFVGMHALQVIPLFLLLLVALAPRFTRLRDERVRLRLVLTVSAVHAAVLALVTWQALRGEPLVHPGGATLGAAALILGCGAAAVYASLRRAPVPMPGPTAEREFSA